jgi:hypothetical protein
MATCANCFTEAVFEYRIADGHSISYCTSHLPKFLNEQKKAGLLKPTPVPVPEPVVVTPPKSSKKSAPVVEATPEEPVTTDAPNS